MRDVGARAEKLYKRTCEKPSPQVSVEWGGKGTCARVKWICLDFAKQLFEKPLALGFRCRISEFDLEIRCARDA